MATLQVSCSPRSTSSSCLHGSIEASLHSPKFRPLRVPLPKLPTEKLVLEDVNQNQRNCQKPTTKEERKNSRISREVEGTSTSIVIPELYAILEAVSDRIEMHANIGEQRNNWNSLLLTSINTITITAATMAGLASSTGGAGAPLLALKLSSALLYSAATGMLLVMNKIQPSQLAEEQRNAVRLFKQLHGQIQTTFALASPTPMDVENAIEKVLALDKAYPLPLLGGVMLEKFPKAVEPAVWYPQGRVQEHFGRKVKRSNGWNAKLEDEMKGIVGMLERKDTKEYMRLSKIILKVNKVLAISGPLLTTIAAFASTIVGSPSHGSWASVLAVVGGALATIVNTIEHGGQVGMIFEMYRGCACSFQQLQQSIEATLEEKEVDMRENGELFEMKVALQLGRSPSELPNLAAASSLSANDDVTEEFASKLL